MLLPALAGVTPGTLGSFACSKWIESLLFGTTPTNPVDFSGVSFLLCAVALGRVKHWKWVISSSRSRL